MKKIIACFIICVIIFISCNSNKNPYENNMGIDPVMIVQMDTVNYTEIFWKDTAINSGRIKTTDTARITFRCKNIGNRPLFIISVQPACGCTVADYSKKPIYPGEAGVINAMYKWNGQIGALRKTIRVRTNTKNASWHTVAFYGEIAKDSVTKK